MCFTGTACAQETVGHLNDRWQAGEPSNALLTAGVLFHQFDNLEDWESGRGWAPCRSGFCAGIVDHMSCSLVNARLPKTFTENSGVILNPYYTKIQCSYSRDGATQGTQGGCSKTQCSLAAGGMGSRWGCSWPPEQLSDMLLLQEQHGNWLSNEVIVKAIDWEALLPNIIEAFVVGNMDPTRAYEAQKAFVAAYPERNVPLVSYNWNYPTEPFKLAMAG